MTEDQEDGLLSSFLEGIEFFWRMDVESTREHLKLHKEDGWPSLRHPRGNGSTMCTHKGFEALKVLVRDRLSFESDHNALDSSDVIREVSDRIVAAVLEASETRGTLNKAFDETYIAAIEAVRREQKEILYHFPCVFASAKPSEPFSIGLVTFTPASLFEAKLTAMDPSRFKNDVRNEDFLQYLRSFGWMVSVTVPACSSSVSQARAELASRTAINIVRVWFGSGYAERMRLVHTEPATSAHTRYLTEDVEGLYLCWSRTSEGARVSEGWSVQVDRGPNTHHAMAGWLLRDILFGERSDIVERIIDALSWFGDAAFEPSPGAKIAKLAMLMERLTITHSRFSKRRFCRYVAILSMNDESDFEVKFWSAYDFYNARSAVVHGGRSQFHSDHWRSLRQAEQMVVNCLFRAIEVYSLIRFRRKDGPASLRDFLTKQDNLQADRWRVLDHELVAKDKASGF